ncbi:MAG: endonuclease III [Sphingopyxis granuli]|uniref:endonuclease III domain-containing protein n=2 Tax=Sphingopyxis granuli TaxID=267128 RepID=UPI003C74BC62
MQMAFSFWAIEDMEWVRDRLRCRFGRPAEPVRVRTPVGQLVKSMISGRIRDAVSLGAYHRLVEIYPEWFSIAQATTAEVEEAIGDVTFPDVKAQYLRDALTLVAADRPDFDLTFLGALDVESALAWLERLPGVGRKVSASTLNFSTLRMPAFVVDTHILRIMRRFGFVRGKGDTRTVYDLTMTALSDWCATDLAELHVLIKRLGQTVCRADRADCRSCPIGRRCRAATFGIRSSLQT